MQRVGGISAKWQPPWWRIAASALGAAAAVVAWSATDAAASTPLRFALPLSLLLAAGIAAAAGLQTRFAAHERDWAEALRDARERLHSLQECLDVWQFRTDASHGIVEWRPPPAASTAGWSENVRGSAFWELFRGADADALRARMAAGAPLDGIEVQRHGDASPWRLHARPRRDGLGRFCGYDGTVREAPTPASPTTVAPPAPAATVTADALGAEQESFSYTVSHDLRAPIRVVEGFTKIVKEDYGRLLDRVGNDHLDRVLGAAARMNNMIDALLALSRLASQPLARQPVNLSQLAAYVADDLRRQSPEREVVLAIEPGIRIEGDPTLLRVVIENLLGNAWKYTAKSHPAQIALERHAGAADTFTVRDNGAGFDMRFADRLFGVFQRLHSANDFPGTGIGLASVRRIVRRHGGEIWGEAEVHRGARFHFSIPQAASAPTQTSLPQTSLAHLSLPQALPQTSLPETSLPPTSWPPAASSPASAPPQIAVPPGVLSQATWPPASVPSGEPLPGAGQAMRSPASSASSNLNA